MISYMTCQMSEKRIHILSDVQGRYTMVIPKVVCIVHTYILIHTLRPWDFRLEIFKYEYNLSRKNIKKINLFIPLFFKDFVIFVRDSQISTQIDFPDCREQILQNL